MLTPPLALSRQTNPKKGLNFIEAGALNLRHPIICVNLRFRQKPPAESGEAGTAQVVVVAVVAADNCWRAELQRLLDA
jgi:hypothetical protein